MKPLITTDNLRSQGYAPLVGAALEPVFQLSGYRGLWMNASGWSSKATRYYAYEVKRNPHRLKHHVQRILHHLSRNDPDQLFGAMIDLFIVLGQHGKALKKRLLQNARNTLRPRQYEQLQLCLQNKRLPQNLPGSSYSVLSYGVVGFKPLIEPANPAAADNNRRRAATANDNDHLQSAQKQQQLEKRVLAGSKDLSLHRSLTALYQNNLDYAAFLDTFSKIEIDEQRLLDLWWATHEYLKENS